MNRVLTKPNSYGISYFVHTPDGYVFIEADYLTKPTMEISLTELKLLILKTLDEHSKPTIKIPVQK